MAENRPFKLETLVDALVLDLDRLQDTIAVKGVNRPLTYTVQDVAFELQVLPRFDGEEVRFVTAGPGDTGTSKISLQLGSITDRQIRETTKAVAQDDVAIDVIEDIEPEKKRELRKLGVRSGRDLERIQDRKIDLDEVTDRRVTYADLADVLNQVRRRGRPPRLDRVTVKPGEGGARVRLEGRNLSFGAGVEGFPAVVVGDVPGRVLQADSDVFEFEVDPGVLLGDQKRVQVALDPYAVLTMTLRTMQRR